MADAAPAAKAKKKKKVDPFKLQSVQDGGKMTKEEKERYKRYDRGEGNSSKAVGNHKLKQRIKRSESKIGASAKAAAQAELLQPTEAGLMEAEGELEYTSRMTQAQIAKAVDLNTACKAYNMTLDRLGPYRISYTADGRRLLLGGRKGHVAVVDWDGSHVGTAGKPRPAQHEQRHTARLHAPRHPSPSPIMSPAPLALSLPAFPPPGKPRVLHEVQVKETVRDVCWLRDRSMCAPRPPHRTPTQLLTLLALAPLLIS